ncbi:VOC family protein [Dactylosporangium sp. NPDC049140]|jgi:catechol 2,3-dioxygenase-like lactoylglutathione lyase family enzyme|uniref:VOC family protein n=1 Tax=Dactylosporangium sp. NPDC049140 TaxID=3155647 RepID=UPI0034019908
MPSRFNGTCLITRDVPGLAAFYAEVLDSEVSGSEVFATVTVTGAVLSFFAAGSMEQMVPGCLEGAGSGNFTLEFEVDDVDACHERLRERYTIVKPPTSQAWGRRSVWLRDPDGNIVNLYRNVPAPQEA